jgi:hypothetical protein
VNTQTLERLREANPIPLKAAEQLQMSFALRERLNGAIAAEDTASQFPLTACPQEKRRRNHFVVAGLGLAAVLAVIVVAPAFGLLRGVVPFFGSPKAPESVQVDFASMNTGAPAGMSPQAIAGETREIGEYQFAGRSHTLWVAPTKSNGFCFEWTQAWGGCHVGSNDLSWSGDLVLPAGVAEPTIQPGSTQTAAVAAAILKAHEEAVPAWISGYVSSAADDVEISFSDGTTVHPEITWVSAPINFGFFAYDIPASQQTQEDHLLNVQARAADGHLIAEQPLNRSR